MRTTTVPPTTGWSFSCRSRPGLLPCPRRACRYRHDRDFTTQAEAKPLGWGWGVGAGLVGAAIVGSAIAASNDGYYYDGYRRCGWVRQYDAYGNFMGRVRNCY